MKNLSLWAFALAVVCSCCQQQNLVAPDQPVLSAQNSQENLNARINNLAPFEKYRLKEHGLSPLTYKDGKLQTVVEYEYSAFGINLTRYEYKSHRSSIETEITATFYAKEPDKIGSRATYLIDENTGRCFESTHQAYAIPGYQNQPTDLKPKTWRYIYNAKGQLTKRFNKNNLLEWFKYDYVNEDLVRATTYNEQGTRVKEIWFSYAQLSGQPLKKNLYPLYIEAADLPDRYLKVFGKSSEHLLTSVSKKYIPLIPSGPYEHLYTYIYNTDGYVTGESKFQAGQTSLFEYKQFVYDTMQ